MIISEQKYTNRNRLYYRGLTEYDESSKLYRETYLTTRLIYALAYSFGLKGIVEVYRLKDTANIFNMRSKQDEGNLRVFCHNHGMSKYLKYFDKLKNNDWLGVLEEEVAFLERRETSPSIDLFFSIVYNYNIMTVKLTKKQLAVLNYLQDFTEEKGYSPSYREMMAGLGLSSVSAVAEHVENLVEKGVLKKVPGAARSLEILDYKHEETVELFKVRMMDCTEEEKKILKEAATILGIDID